MNTDIPSEEEVEQAVKEITTYIHNVQEAIREVDYMWEMYKGSTTPLQQANRLTELCNRMWDLRTYLPDFEYQTGTVAWEREIDA